MQQAQAMQGKMQELQQEIAAARITGEAGAGLVSVTLNGTGEAQQVSIDDSVYEESKEVLEDLVAAAFNDAQRKAAALQKEKMAQLTGGLGGALGGLGNLFGR